MATKTQYWLVTTKSSDCSGYATFAIAKHPAEYMAKHAKESLIFAMPVTKQEFRAVDRACRESPLRY